MSGFKDRLPYVALGAAALALAGYLILNKKSGDKKKDGT